MQAVMQLMFVEPNCMQWPREDDPDSAVVMSTQQTNALAQNHEQWL